MILGDWKSIKLNLGCWLSCNYLTNYKRFQQFARLFISCITASQYLNFDTGCSQYGSSSSMLRTLVYHVLYKFLYRTDYIIILNSITVLRILGASISLEIYSTHLFIHVFLMNYIFDSRCSFFHFTESLDQSCHTLAVNHVRFSLSSPSFWNS